MKKILVVVDVQNDFITGALGNAECVEAEANAVKYIAESTYDKVFLTQDTHTEDYMNTREGEKLPVPHCIKGTKGYEVTEAIQQIVAEKYSEEAVEYVEKPTFGSVALGEKLREIYEAENKQLEIDFLGVCTGICVISNVMLAKANCPEAVIRVVSKSCACVTPASHNTALEAMKMCHIDIM